MGGFFHECKKCVSAKVLKKQAEKKTGKENGKINMKDRRVKIRPPLEEILELVSTIGYCATGRKFGVSDNSIRKWIKWEQQN